jgi:hypothetical protein
MRKHGFIAFVFLLLAGLLTSEIARADSWDYVYGEDPTNANNVSGFTDVRADPLGGAFVAGYFYGTFEGLNSNGQWARFVQHRSQAGLVEWTQIVERISANSPPQRPIFFEVDSEGVVYLPTNENLIVSISRDGQVHQSSAGQFHGTSVECVVFDVITDDDPGIITLCVGTPHVSRYSSSFVRLWDVVVSNRMSSSFARWDASLTQGSDQDFWLVSSFNRDKLGEDTSNLPLVYRPALGLTRFNSTTGTEIMSAKHYGLVRSQTYAIGTTSHSLWIGTTSLGEQLTTRVTTFDLQTGEVLGSTSNNLNVYGDNPSWDAGSKWATDNGLPIQWLGCAGGVLTTQHFAWLNAELDCLKTELLNDGRRLVMRLDSQLLVFEINGTHSPTISRLIRNKEVNGTVSDMDADDLGNIYVVGKTFEQVVLNATSSDVRERSSLTSSRAFVLKNPGGRLGLTVLPRTPLRFKVTGTNGVPASGVGAVSMNVTVTSSRGEGFVTAYPCDSRPDASNLNYVLNQTVPNAVIAPVSANGEVCFYTYAETHLIADVNGYFPTGSGFVSNTPARVFDTRVGSAQGLRTVSKTKVGDGTELRVQLTNLPGGITPATGVGAVSLNVTVTGSRAPNEGGFVTVYPCGNRPDASNLNFRSGQTVPNAVITPVSANGEVCFYVFGSTDLIADINGYFPGGAGFVATEPVRVADTRIGSAQGLRTVTKQRIGGNTTLQLQLTNLPGGITPASGIGAVSLNVTAVNTTANEYGGYVTTYPCGALPDVSSLNFVSNEIVPNAVIAPLSANGTICFYAYGQTDLIVDLNGYFPTGAGFVPVNPKRMFDTR